jgi:hypothetical protein
MDEPIHVGMQYRGSRTSGKRLLSSHRRFRVKDFFAAHISEQDEKVRPNRIKTDSLHRR